MQSIKSIQFPSINHVSPTKVFGELLCIERGAHEDDLQVRANGEEVPDDHQQDVRLQVPLVDLVQNEMADGGQRPVQGEWSSASVTA